MLKFNPLFYTDVRIEEINLAHYHYVMGEIENFINRKRKGAFLRVYDGNKWFYGVTTDLENIQAELEKLYLLAKPNPNINDDPIVKMMPVTTGSKLKFVDNNVSLVDSEIKVALLKTNFHLFQDNNRIVMWQALYVDKYIKKHIINSRGADISFDWQQCGVVYFFNMRDGEKTFQERFEKAADSFESLKADESEVAEYLKKSEYFMLNSKPLEPGMYKTILSPAVAGVFAHESFGHKSEADFMLGDENMKKEWELGKKVGVDTLTIVDDGNMGGTGFTSYDDEGYPARKTYLIKNGLLSGRLHSTETSVSLNEEPTGNARAINFEYEPIVRMTCTFIEPGTLTKDELFAKVDKGIFIERIKHGSGMSTFTLAPSFAYFIENGKITYPVQISVVTGSVFETLGKITGLSDTKEILSFAMGGCGKAEQYPLPVSFGGPYVLISELNAQ